MMNFLIFEILLIVAALGNIAAGIVSVYKRLTVKWVEVPAFCQSVKIKQSIRDRSTTYSPVWRAVYQGQEMTFECDRYTSRVYHEGDEETIKVNPDDPSKYIDGNSGFAAAFHFVFGGVVAACCACLGLYMISN